MKGVVDETRLMMEGKLVEMGREPLNVQVIVGEDSHGREFVSLRDVSGVFVEAGALEETEEDGTGNDEEGRGEEEREPEMEETSEQGDLSIARELAESRTHRSCHGSLRASLGAAYFGGPILNR